MKRFRTLSSSDKLKLDALLKDNGFKARTRKMQDGAIRIVLPSRADIEPISKLLNESKFRYAGGMEFDKFTFDGNQTWVRLMEV